MAIYLKYILSLSPPITLGQLDSGLRRRGSRDGMEGVPEVLSVETGGGVICVQEAVVLPLVLTGLTVEYVAFALANNCELKEGVK